MRIKLFLALFISLFFSLNCFAQTTEKNIVRVGLSNQNFSSRNFYEVNLKSDNNIKIIDTFSNIQIAEIEANKVIKISLDNELFKIETNEGIYADKLQGPLLFNSNSELQILDLNRKGTPAKYKGMVEIKKANSNEFNVINIIDMQNYLRGVIPNEMPVSFGLEALKAQAVAARNYATNAQISPDFDVVDSTASQVYYGANSYNPISDKAVETTKGIYALYHEKPISALYFSTSPGITDDWDDVFGSGTPSQMHPYLKARYDKENQEPLKNESDVIDFYSKKNNGLDINSPKFRWSIEFTREELENVLKSSLETQSKMGLVTPKYDGKVPLEGLKEIKALKRTQSGKIIELLIKSKTGDYVVKKELGIRRVLKKNGSMLPSANFYIETKGKESLEDKEKEDIPPIFSFFEIDEKYPTSFKITGGGFGHGVGMSQFGAYNLAKNGKKYPDILKHYYTSINLSTIPKKVQHNEYNVFYKTEFYYDSTAYKEAYLYINNSRNINEFSFKINDYLFNSTEQISNNKIIKINITQYLKHGSNIISFTPLMRENKDKYLIYRIEFL